MAIQCEWNVLTGSKEVCMASEVPECFVGNVEGAHRTKKNAHIYDLCRKHYDMMLSIWFRVKQ